MVPQAYNKNRVKQGLDNAALKTACYIIITVFALLCLFPFALMITSSFMEEKEIISEGFKLFPKKFTTSAYEFLLSNPKKLIDSYKVTIIITVAGTFFGLFFMSMTGYVLNRKDFKYRNFFSFFIYFTTLFSGGLIPSYILMVRYLGLKNSILSMILPSLMSAWSIFLMRNFMRSVPDSMYESATIDGAGDFRIYWQIYMPLSIPALATVGLFQALGYWNQWYNAMLYIESAEKFPLQYFLQKMVNQANVQFLISKGIVIDASELPSQSIKMATAVVATGPIILLYPFVQRYFISGLTVGAVKG
ncbi:sugar ABC transporter permease [Clostridium thermosuccinogenes]|jgi:putative aldouronate transport system permease protein|uniref:Sugar ABC transporter permease n=1 Tax=Clostridium thermosuccinogenes TaxID=84032 RepID=A0A2K2F9R1_9CLOT|nr:carbohydrate ABC transporter permease [Pseudoclostridium thermosuccinogenes]AUS95381.1 sugar ABC transporter permease [Pseudoclostridium thermosuccinogenes]PNT90561.1 sugar ABC transporter permease [Pseudoclostridium thermosuccinogenes]PNT95494.1 sugar ABC transporter permease [Pseudoclostridium thermosuccinogenes]PNT96500.1 sugar ABC transporter permease [Pseudoclostridium thermosuccinogenes]